MITMKPSSEYLLPEIKAIACVAKHEPGTPLDHGFWKAGERRYACLKCGHACYKNGDTVS